MPSLSSQQIFERLTSGLQIEQCDYDEGQVAKADRVITDFQAWVKKIEPFLTKLKTDLNTMTKKKQQNLGKYKKLSELLGDYEETNLLQYSDIDVNQQILNNPNNAHLKQALIQLLHQQNNFSNLYLWVKGENYDLQAFKTAIAIRNGINTKVKELKKKNTNTQKAIQTAIKNEGQPKGVLSGMKKDAAKLENELSTREAETEFQMKLSDMLTVYLGGKCIDEYKRAKLHLYKNVMAQFHSSEIKNHHNAATFWAKVMEDPNVKSAMNAN